MPPIGLVRSGLQRIQPYAGRLLHDVKTNPRWALGAGVAGGLGAGYLVGSLSEDTYEIYEEKREDGTIIRKIVKNDDRSIVLGIIILIVILAGAYLYFKKRKS